MKETMKELAPKALSPDHARKELSPLANQVGGEHYKHMAIQPLEYCHANNIGKIEGDVIAYVSRWRAKNGLEDLRKAIHELEILIELEGKKALREAGWNASGQLGALPRAEAGECLGATPQPAIPEGYALVPVLTLAFLLEAWDYGQFADDFDQPLAKPVRAAIRTMLAAAKEPRHD